MNVFRFGWSLASIHPPGNSDSLPNSSGTRREGKRDSEERTVFYSEELQGLCCLWSLFYMALVMRPMALQPSVVLSENALDCSSPALAHRVASTSRSVPGWQNSLSGFRLLPRQSSSMVLNQAPRTRRQGLKIFFALNTEGLPGNNGDQGLNGNDDTDLNRTRLGRIVSAGGRQLLQKLNSARRNIPMKIFLLLLGFYTANALATILGQTGDWDVLVAGVVVAAIEGIGMLMYRRRGSVSGSRLQSFVTMMNFWKAGVILGLFVDAFKLGS
ncbi:hypothetical protein MLD38_036166 [Melastoma candidum]|uniref:Uncharacterized protein n=1 Tax=Melastoma candidum TaxID=119954 RepID=A0ACB9LIW4_9MYRT|nr:hypothetical protein MLD38_036166 [Melastoma candidum]